MHLFVYGTLRQDAGHPMHEVLRAAAHRIGPGRARGVLYRVDWYPAVVLDDAAGWVTGELYQIHDPAGLAVLDDYEGAGPPPSEYRRVTTRVWLEHGEVHEAWIYEYAWSVDGLVRIESGDFLRREP